MSTVKPFPESVFTRLEQQNDWLDSLPKLLALRGGIIYANFVTFRAVRSSRKTMQLVVEFMRDPRFGADQIEHRREFVLLLSQVVDRMSQTLAWLKSGHDSGVIVRSLVTSYADLVDDYSDLVDTAALSADTEMSELATKLSNAL